MNSVFDMNYNGQVNACDIPNISGWDIGNWNAFKGTNFASTTLTCKNPSFLQHINATSYYITFDLFMYIRIVCFGTQLPSTKTLALGMFLRVQALQVLF